MSSVWTKTTYLPTKLFLRTFKLEFINYICDCVCAHVCVKIEFQKVIKFLIVITSPYISLINNFNVQVQISRAIAFLFLQYSFFSNMFNKFFTFTSITSESLSTPFLSFHMCVRKHELLVKPKTPDT